MKTVAVVVKRPKVLALSTLDLNTPQADDVVVDVAWTGISTGTEKLLWSGRMPHFPGMGYPLVPGYETVGRISKAGSHSNLREGDTVFVPGANCFGNIKGLFGGAASKLVVSVERIVPIEEKLGENAILLALAATAHHAIGQMPELIVGHGVLGRLLARIAIALGAPAPTVWERNAVRRGDAVGYQVIGPDDDPKCDYNSIYDASGDSSLLDALISRLAKGGEVTLAGFYEAPLSFAFPPAFMREARIRVAAEWKRQDIEAVSTLITSGKLDLSGLITHHAGASDAPHAYHTAFTDPRCLKMVLDWRTLQ